MRSLVLSSSRPLVLALALLAACGGSKSAEEAPTPAEEPLRPLALLASQRVIVMPAHIIVGGDAMGWSAMIPNRDEYLKQLDDQIATVFAERGLKSQWIYPPDLVRAARSNPTYAVDPYTTGVNVLRAAAIKSGSRYGDPLATQLRTMIALQSDARAVLVPVELRFEKLPNGQGVAALKVAMLDARLSDVRWIGTVRSEPSPTLTPAVLASVAARFADLITAP